MTRRQNGPDCYGRIAGIGGSREEGECGMKSKVCGVCGKAYDSGTFYRCPHCMAAQRRRQVAAYVDAVIAKTAVSR